MNIDNIPVDVVENGLIPCFDLSTFYRFSTTNKENAERLTDDKYWKKYMDSLSLSKDPCNQHFKKNYKAKKIILLFNDVKLTLGIYYRNYLIDKYTINLQEARNITLLKRQLCILEKDLDPSELDLFEIETISKRISLYDKKIEKYNKLQYSFHAINKQYQENSNKRYREIFERNQTRLVLLLEYLCNPNVFEYDDKYSSSVSQIKIGFKKYSKRFTKITPCISSCELYNGTLQKYSKHLEFLCNIGLLRMRISNYDNNVTYIFSDQENINKYKSYFYESDRIYGLKFKT